MKISLYMYRDYNSTSLKILKLLDKCNITPKIIIFESGIDLTKVSKKIGHSVRRLPKVVIDNEFVGGYYDLVEYLIKKKVINYTSEVL